MRSTSLNLSFTSGPRPVASADRLNSLTFEEGGSSPGGGTSLGKQTEKVAVTTPMLVEVGSFSATALFEYSMTWNVSLTALLRCQPLMSAADFAPTMYCV